MQDFSKAITSLLFIQFKRSFFLLYLSCGGTNEAKLSIWKQIKKLKILVKVATLLSIYQVNKKNNKFGEVSQKKDVIN